MSTLSNFLKHGFRNFSNKYLVEKSVEVFVLFLFPWFINTDKYFGDCHSCPSVGPCCSQLSKAWVGLGFLFLSKRVEVCCQLRAENSSVAKEVEALDRMVWTATPSPSLVSWGLAWARVGCQGLKQRKRRWNIFLNFSMFQILSIPQKHVIGIFKARSFSGLAYRHHVSIRDCK